MGIMQYRSEKYISNLESVKLGTKKLIEHYETALIDYKAGKKDYTHHYYLEQELIGCYNRGEEYAEEVSNMWEIIMSQFYPDWNEQLLPPDETDGINESEIIKATDL